jgi:hypothetical protein
MLYFTAEHIRSGEIAWWRPSDGKLHATQGSDGQPIGRAREELREGFRVNADPSRGGIYEDDA